jgi:hypothetical protein
LEQKRVSTPEKSAVSFSCTGNSKVVCWNNYN